MNKTNKNDLKLKLGNLFLAIWLSTVPTVITYGALGLHGVNICRSLNKNLEIQNKSKIKASCDKASWETTKSYIILIGFFITLPTWFWFYFSVKQKKAKP